MIEIIAVLTVMTVLAIGYYVSKKTKTEGVCKVWVQENRSTEWVCIERLK
ncbi:hypothetical protein [Desulfobacula sp.]|nr:hypothetical protein [Desulfobacula sp.]